MAAEVQDPLGEAPGISPAPAPAAKIPDYLAGITPGTGMLAQPGIPAAQMLGGTSADLARQAAALMPPPDPQKLRDAEAHYADTVQDYQKTGDSYLKSYNAKAAEVELAAQQYQDKAQSLLPQTAAVQPAPPRSLRAFLAPTANEDPYTTVSKFMQSVSLLATMMGGGRNGARASVSALTGAVEGWAKGDRYRADSEYQTWKDQTDALFKQFDDEMRRYNSIMIAERVPLEQKLRALETSAWLQKNAMAQKAFEVGEARSAFEHLDKMRQAGVKAQLDAATIQGMEERARQNYEALQQKIEQGNDKLAQQIAAKASEQNLRWEIEKLRNERRLDDIERKANQRPLDAQDSKLIDSALDIERSFARMDALLASGKVDLNKIMGGIQPWLNSISQRWGGRAGSLPPEGSEAGQIDRKLIKGRLTPEEDAFLATMGSYASKLINQRYGSNVTGGELDRYLTYGLDPHLSPATNRTRWAELRNDNISGLRDKLNRMEQSGKRIPDIGKLIPAQAQTSGGQTDPNGLKQVGGEYVSPDGKYAWRGGAWVAR